MIVLDGQDLKRVGRNEEIAQGHSALCLREQPMESNIFLSSVRCLQSDRVTELEAVLAVSCYFWCLIHGQGRGEIARADQTE